MHNILLPRAPSYAQKEDFVEVIWLIIPISDAKISLASYLKRKILNILVISPSSKYKKILQHVNKTASPLYK